MSSRRQLTWEQHTHTYVHGVCRTSRGNGTKTSFHTLYFRAYLLVVHCQRCRIKLPFSSSLLSFLQRISASCIARTLIYVLSSAALPLVSFFRSRLIRFRAKKTQQQQLGVLSINILWQTCCCCCWEQAGRKKKGDFSIKKFRHEITIACNKYLKYRIYQ